MVDIGDELTINGITGNFIRWKVQDKIAILFDGKKNHEVEVKGRPVPEKGRPVPEKGRPVPEKGNRPTIAPKKKDSTTRCRVCGQYRDNSEFRKHSNGHQNKTCNVCLNKNDKKSLVNVKPESDKVNQPNHYIGNDGLEVEIVLANFIPRYTDGYVAHRVASAIEYLLRSPAKNGTEDIKKAKRNLEQVLIYMGELAE